MSFTVPELPYAYNALEPHIDEQTMRLHHDKHHATYVQKLNTALEDTEWLDKDIKEVLTSLDKLPADKQKAVRNNGGGHYNHSLFWPMMCQGGTEMPAELQEHIEKDFGSVDAFKEEFANAVRPDLILLDLNLPGMDGREVLAEVKADASLKQIPVVVLTTSADEEDVLRSYNLNANCYVTKPIDTHQFIHVVQLINEFWLAAVKLPVE